MTRPCFCSTYERYSCCCAGSVLTRKEISLSYPRLPLDQYQAYHCRIFRLRGCRVRVGGLLIPNRSATPGKYQTGSTANLVTASSPSSFRQIFPSGTRRPALTLCSSSGNFMCAFVMAIVGLTWIPSCRTTSEYSQGAKCPSGSIDTIFFSSAHCGNGPTLTAGSVLKKSGLWSTSRFLLATARA